MSRARITQVNAGDSPGPDFCIGIAKAFKISPVLVLELAGIIPPQPRPDDPQLQRLYDLYNVLSEAERGFVLRMLEGLARRTAPPGE